MNLVFDRLDYNGFNVNVGAIHKKVQVLEEENLQLKFEVCLLLLWQTLFHHWQTTVYFKLYLVSFSLLNAVSPCGVAGLVNSVSALANNHLF